MAEMNGTFKPAKTRRKAAPVKRLTVSPEARQAYVDIIQAKDRREQEHGRFLPEDMKGKR